MIKTCVRWGALLLAFSPACGEIQSLGDNLGGSAGTTGGDISNTSGGSGVGGHAGGVTHVGGSRSYGGQLSAQGGETAAAGEPSIQGGEPSVGEGGASSSSGGRSNGAGGRVIGAGGRLSEGGSDIGAGAVSSEHPYPLDPTLPLPNDCSCVDPDRVCDADSVCRPRCEPSGTCALFTIPRDAVDLRAEGETLYILVDTARDPLGNAIGTGERTAELRRADSGYAGATQIARFDASDLPNKILGRASATTFVRGDAAVWAVDDDGTIRELAAPVGFLDVVLASDTLLFLTNTGLSGLAFDSGATAQTILTHDFSGTGFKGLYLSNYIWMRSDATLCTVPAAAPTTPITCVSIDASWDPIVGVSGDYLYRATLAMTRLERFGIDGVSNFLAYQTSTLNFEWQVLADGYIYAYFLGDRHFLFQRFPADTYGVPVPVIPESVSGPMFQTLSGQMFVDKPWLFAIGSKRVFWAQPSVEDADFDQPRYVFSSPLPE